MDEEYGSFGMVGNSDPMKRLYETIARVAPADVIVLITGERGTGKELVARAIHRHSKRSGKKFVVVDSPAVPSEIFESELFGHERGAFTGARERRIGKMEYANNGTVFFDGIEHLSLTLQPKLLRIVEQQEFSRMGGNEIIRTDVRLISATAYDLKRLSEEGRFRPELYDRLHGIHVHVPLLKDRMGDVPLLAVYFLGERRIEPEALEFMCQYS
jgi:DNA-binding NtrC family response regulator